MTLRRTLPILGLLFASGALAQISQSQGRWKADWNNLAQHKAPEWLLDAKFGVQYVGPQLDLDDYQAWHWGRSAQRHRDIGSPAPDPHVEAFLTRFSIVGKLPYVWVHKPIEDHKAVLARYHDLGARFVVSMIEAAYPGTEGLMMDRKEIEAARALGMHVGIHYNLLRREGLPSIGDTGYVEWTHKRLRDSVEAAGAEFVFFDGCQAPSDYFKTAEFMAWYYNWAERNGRQVWVNDDLGNDRYESGEYGDVVDFESYTVEGISPKPWVNWDILRNDWTCWVNEFGIHKVTGEKWVWQYKQPEDLLRIFLETVSKGGVWLVQMDNTKRSWEVLSEIGAWLKVNGEAIYGTRPYGTPNTKVVRLPDNKDRPKNRRGWWWQFEESLKIAQKQPVYFTQKGGVLYAIHWGWPAEGFSIPGVRPRAGAKVRMLGVDQDLSWRISGDRLLVDAPAARPAANHAYAIRIPVGN